MLFKLVILLCIVSWSQGTTLRKNNHVNVREVNETDDGDDDDDEYEDVNTDTDVPADCVYLIYVKSTQGPSNYSGLLLKEHIVASGPIEVGEKDQVELCQNNTCALATKITKTQNFMYWAITDTKKDIPVFEGDYGNAHCTSNYQLQQLTIIDNSKEDDEMDYVKCEPSCIMGDVVTCDGAGAGIIVVDDETIRLVSVENILKEGGFSDIPVLRPFDPVKIKKPEPARKPEKNVEEKVRAQKSDAIKLAIPIYPIFVILSFYTIFFTV